MLLALFADLSALAAVDRDLDRYSFAGGASIYPFAWNVLLAARAEGLGGVITTMLIREEGAVKELLGAPDPLALAAVIALAIRCASPAGCSAGRSQPSPPSTGWTGRRFPAEVNRLRRFQVSERRNPLHATPWRGFSVASRDGPDRL